MRVESVEERFLINYLLGNLPEEEQVRVEDNAFTDTRYLAALEAAEADLIDAYVRGDLRHEEHAAFERRFLQAPARRRKVRFARALAEVV